MNKSDAKTSTESARMQPSSDKEFSTTNPGWDISTVSVCSPALHVLEYPIGPDRTSVALLHRTVSAGNTDGGADAMVR